MRHLIGYVIPVESLSDLQDAARLKAGVIPNPLNIHSMSVDTKTINVGSLQTKKLFIVTIIYYFQSSKDFKLNNCI